MVIVVMVVMVVVMVIISMVLIWTIIEEFCDSLTALAMAMAVVMVMVMVIIWSIYLLSRGCSAWTALLLEMTAAWQGLGSALLGTMGCASSPWPPLQEQCPDLEALRTAWHPKAPLTSSSTQCLRVTTTPSLLAQHKPLFGHIECCPLGHLCAKEGSAQHWVPMAGDQGLVLNPWTAAVTLGCCLPLCPYGTTSAFPTGREMLAQDSTGDGHGNARQSGYPLSLSFSFFLSIQRKGKTHGIFGTVLKVPAENQTSAQHLPARFVVHSPSGSTATHRSSHGNSDTQPKGTVRHTYRKAAP